MGMTYIRKTNIPEFKALESYSIKKPWFYDRELVNKLFIFLKVYRTSTPNQNRVTGKEFFP